MKTPPDCGNMEDIRAGIDLIDAALVGLLAQRAGYIDRAAQIKAESGLPARIGVRVEQVIANVRRHAEAKNLPPDAVEALWRQLIDWSIAREETVLDTTTRDI